MVRALGQRHRLAKVAALCIATLEVSALHIEIEVGAGAERRLEWAAGDDLLARASTFATAHGLEGGGGCADAACVAERLRSAMEVTTLAALGESNGSGGNGGGSTTLLEGDPSPVWSQCGWHGAGNWDAAVTPLPVATARSEARMAAEAARWEASAEIVAGGDALLETLRSVPLACDPEASGAEASSRDGDPRRAVRPPCEARGYEELFDPVDTRTDERADPRAGKGTILAIGILSAPGNLGHRLAIRRTWLALPLAQRELVQIRFFVGISLRDLGDDELAEADARRAGGPDAEAGTAEADARRSRMRRRVALTREAAAYGDIALLDMEDHYMATPRKVVSIFRWGVEACGAYWVLRANDDVFLRLEPTLTLLQSSPPANIYMGLMVDGRSMSVPRPEHYNDTKENIYKATKSWTFERVDYPSDAVPNFAQGNAMVLSRDLAAELADLARRPWFRLMADDVMVALVVAKFRPYELVVRADYEFEGLYTACHDDALWHFNIHPEHMYDLYHAWQLGLPPCHAVERFCCG